jgi:hypothetical protein
MGLSSYGKFNPSIPNFFDLNKNHSDTEILFEQIQNQKGNIFMVPNILKNNF